MPPESDRYQNTIGTWLTPRRSEAIHCTRNRAAKSACAMKPKAARRSQCHVRGSYGCMVFLNSILRIAKRAVRISTRTAQYSMLNVECAFESLLPHAVRKHPLRHPPHRHAIGQSAEGAIHRTVLGYAELARAMVDRHLHDFVAVHPHQRRQKTMHAGVEPDAVDRF